METNRKTSKWHGWRALTGLVAALVMLSLLGASPASASAYGAVILTGGQTVNIYGQAVPIPWGEFTFEVKGDNYYVEEVEAVYDGKGISNWQIDFDFINDANEVYWHLAGERHGDPGVWWAQDGYAIDREVEPGLVCAHLVVRDAEVATTCHQIWSGFDWTPWS